MSRPVEPLFGGEPVFSSYQDGHSLQVWPHPDRGTVQVRSRIPDSFTGDVIYYLSGETVREFARDVLKTAGGDEAFIVSRDIAYPVQESGQSLLVGVGNNVVCVDADSSPERLETMAANLAAAAAFIRDTPERVMREERKLRERQEAIMRALGLDDQPFTGLGLKARTAVEAAIEAQDERAAADRELNAV